MRIKTVLIVAAAIAILAFAANSLVTTIPPHSMTLTAITETHVRMHLYLVEHRECPDSLSALLLGLLREQEGVAAMVLTNLGLKPDEVREEILNL